MALAVNLNQNECSSMKKKNKKKLKLPLIEDGSLFPGKSKCPMCGKSLIGNFVMICGGAMYGTRKSAGTHDKMLGFLDIICHFDDKEHFSSVSVVENSAMGQFDIYACSHDCLRELIMGLIDASERKYRKGCGNGD